MRLLPVLLLLLPLLTAATQIPFLRLSRRLTRLRAPQICSARKNADLELLSRQLALARACLPFRERVSQQALCRTRPETAATAAACARLAACPRVRPIKRAINATLATTCPTPVPRFRRLERRWVTRLNRRIRAAGLPHPVYPTIILEPRRVERALVLLHGLGDSAINRLPLAVDVQRRLPRTRVVLPQAPAQFVTFFNDTRNSWFDILGNTADAPQATAEILAAAAGVDAIGDVQKAVYGLDRKKVGVVGISQGAALALTTWLRHTWGTVSSVSGFLPIADSYPAGLGGGSGEVEALMIHGRMDGIVPFPLGVLSRDLIRAFGRKVRWVELTGDHFLPFEQDIVLEKIVIQSEGALAEE